MPTDYIGYKSKNNLENARKDGFLINSLCRYQIDERCKLEEEYFLINNKETLEESYKNKSVSLYGEIIDEFLDKDKYKNSILGYTGYKFPNFYLQNNKTHLPTTRERFYLNRKQMEFYKDYFHYYQSKSNLNEKNAHIIENYNLFLLPESIDSNDIEEFKRIDRFLLKIYIKVLNIKKGLVREKDKDRTIIIMPENDKIIYLRYINFFNEHYENYLIEGTNLIFIGTKYDMKTKEELENMRHLEAAAGYNDSDVQIIDYNS